MNVTMPHASTAVRTFTQQLSSTRRGARLARLLTAAELRAWQMSPSVVERSEQIVAELAANAVLHGRVQGRDFRLALHLDLVARLLRITVTDARGDRLPSPASELTAPPDAESGRGLLMVTALADRWGTEPCPPGGKTVWAELVTPAPPLE
ncbi:Histidine kinase-like ATPase domain-containing protein [Streptomyces sp. 1222.5]|uniref:ATP-binding protein n=1 Tax=unclassified Streptomyces TaxID=2593676 RepID=UPI0008952E49|nr:MULTISPECIES: ATP-binding protein [unclassified Streptomyces]PKW11142.1 histidine kinase-like protein [Streptomyces sp. 5112.2]SEB86977.1 Histidine kinase-like ATPase domain-containing protein [Streptomyces sp. 1222.5]